MNSHPVELLRKFRFCSSFTERVAQSGIELAYHNVWRKSHEPCVDRKALRKAIDFVNWRPRLDVSAIWGVFHELNLFSAEAVMKLTHVRLDRENITEIEGLDTMSDITHLFLHQVCRAIQI